MSDCFISKALSTGAVSERKFELLCRVLNAPAEKFMRQASKTESRFDEQGPYSVGLVVRPDKVRLTIRHEGQDILSAWSYIKGPYEADLVQAISYAAHMCYKLAEQNKLAKDKED